MAQEKITIEKLAEMTRDEFGSVRRDMTTEFASVRRDMAALNGKMDNGFSAMRKEMQENTRVILAAVQTVEYTKLRIRLDTLENRMDKVERTGRR